MNKGAGKAIDAAIYLLLVFTLLALVGTVLHSPASDATSVQQQAVVHDQIAQPPPAGEGPDADAKGYVDLTQAQAVAILQSWGMAASCAGKLNVKSHIVLIGCAGYANR